MKRSWFVLAAALTVASCSGGGGASGITPAPPVSAPSAPSASQAAFIYGANALTGATYVGAAAANQIIGVDVELTPQNAAGLASYAAAVSNPKSPSYRHFLTPQQIGASYGASSTNIAAVAKYFESYKLHVGTWPQHLSIFVSGTTSAMGQAFGTTFGVYTQKSQQFIAPESTPHFAQTLAVAGVTRLISAPRSFRDLVPIGQGAVTGSGYFPQQIRNAFDYTTAYSAGYTGTGITIGIVGTGPIDPSDVPAYGTMFDTPVATVTQEDVTDQGVAEPGIEDPPDTGFQTPPPATADCNGFLPDCNPEDVEAQVDTEAAASLAPGASVHFYLGYDPAYCENVSTGVVVAGPCGTGEQPLLGLPLSDDEIQQVIADDTADVLSLSFGGPEQLQAGYEFSATAPDTGIGPQEFQALAAEGVAVFVSSGDSGAEGCQNPVFAADEDDPCVSYPATDPNVTAVGGVTAPLDQFGNLTNQIIGWGITTGQGAGGSGGGVSAYFSQTLTPWQQNVYNITGTMRNVPDTSLLGDPETGMAVLLYANLGGPDVESVGGTSVAAPETAAMWALVLQACKASSSCATAQGPYPYRLGNAAPLLYALYANGPAVSNVLPTYAQTFYDVVYGDNSQTSSSGGSLDPGYNAGPDYDLVSGLGVPFARALIKGVAHQ